MADDQLQDKIKDVIEDAIEKSKVHPVKSLLTNSDNETFCIARVSGILALLTGLGLQIWIVIHTGLFDILQFSTGVGVLIGAVSGSVRLKDSAESKN